jgi:hypothetical protein
MKKGAAYLNVWMEVMRQLHLSVSYCRAKKYPEAENSIDKAVVFYAGSLTVEEGNEGILLYALAQVRSRQMKTAGHLDNKDIGDAYVNVQIFKEFKAIQLAVKKNATLCDEAEASRKRIVDMMKIPLIQGVVFYAYRNQFETADKDPEEQQRMSAEAATFASTALPWIHSCDSREARIVHENMRLGAATNFADVQKALERSYACMNINCTSIGGIWDHELGRYKDGALPCGFSYDSKTSGSAIGSILGISVGVLLVGWVFLRYRKKLLKRAKKDKSMQPMYTGNIAAVTEIA